MTASYPTSVKSFGADVVNGDYVLAAHVNDLRAEIVAAETALTQALPMAAAGSVNTETLSANKTLVDADKAVQSLTSSAARDITLPAVGTANHGYYIVNRSSYTFTIKNSSGGTVGSVTTGATGICISDGAGWKLLTGGSGGASLSVNTKGDLQGFDTAANRVAIGTDGQVLTADSAQALGLKWATPAGGGVSVTTKGDLQGYTTVAARVPVGSNDQILTADSAQAAGVKWAAPANQLSVTTKGDIQTYSTVKDRLAVGTNGFVLVPDNAAATGLKWQKAAPLVSSAASAATLTPDAAAYDQYCFTALAAALTINAPTNVYDGAKLTIRLKDNGTARGLTWNAVFRAVGVTLPTTTVLSKVLYVGFIYNSAETKWDCVAVAQEA